VHEHGIIHRDLNPQNVFLTARNGTRDFVKVLNFGVAHLTSAALEEGETGSGQLCCASDYVSPELALAQSVDHRADLYSLGCLMYQVLTGEPPFKGTSVIDIVNKHIQEQPVPPRQLRPDLDIAPDIEAVVLRALEKDPERRFQTAAELVAAIDACRHASRRLLAFAPEGVARAIEDRAPAPHRRSSVSFLAVATALAASGAAAIVYAALR
jgi:serine/threonine-protein kinase